MVKKSSIRTGGYVPLTTIDYPGMLAAVVFLSGCPWNCPYCHNAALRDFHYSAGPTWEEILGHLGKRQGLLEGVVFSGGEPTAQTALGHAIMDAKDFGFAIGLHTAGAYPEKLEAILPLVDWVGLDIKAPPDDRYDRLVQKPGAARNFLHSLQLVQESGVDFTLRTTVDPRWTPAADWRDLQNWLAGQGLPPSHRQEADPVISYADSGSG
jgi:pyruvate formate lyase activating enzyme